MNENKIINKREIRPRPILKNNLKILTPQKIYVVIGPTASGKSEHAVTLAKKCNGEIISADSRQVYRELNIGTGKVTGKWQKIKDPHQKTNFKNVFIYKGIVHHLIDFVSPKRQYSVADFKKNAEKIMAQILANGKSVIICGGTGQYVDSLIFNQSIPEVLPNLNFRKKMEAKSASALFEVLQKKDPARANTIDRHNKRRLIRALEIIHATGKPIPVEVINQNIKVFTHGGMELPMQIIYLNPPRAKLYKNIEIRLKSRLKAGMIAEIKKLHAARVTWKRMEELGLEYRYVSRYVRGLTNYETMYTELLREIQQYSKRQQTWFRKYEKLTEEPK